METVDLQERIDAFPVWHYEFEFERGARTRIYPPDFTSRHIQRQAPLGARLRSDWRRLRAALAR
jgi:hypothetical protein